MPAQPKVSTGLCPACRRLAVARAYWGSQSQIKIKSKSTAAYRRFSR